MRHKELTKTYLRMHARGLLASCPGLRCAACSRAAGLGSVINEFAAHEVIREADAPTHGDEAQATAEGPEVGGRLSERIG